MFQSISFRSLFVGYALTSVVVVSVSAFSFARWIESHVREGVLTDLRHHAIAMKELAVPALTSGPSDEFLQSIRVAGAELSARITVLDETGLVLADSLAEPSRMDNHSNRPEVLGAREESFGSATRRSGTLERPMVYVALRVPGAAGSLGYVRSSVFSDSVDAQISQARGRLVLSSCFAVLLGLCAAGAFAFRHSRPLSRLATEAEAIAGEEKARLTSAEPVDDLSRVGRAVSRMARELLEQRESKARGQVRLLTVLSSMIEGVVVVDRNQRVIHCNAAARELLRVDGLEGDRPWIWELCEIRALANASEEAVRRGRESSEDLEFSAAESRRFVKLNASPVRSLDGSVVGGVIVLHDVTPLRRLEVMRRDFVANVSHELKTPVAAIRATTETILDDDELDVATRQRFLGKIIGQCHRLSSLVTDLLQLARLEAAASDLEFSTFDLGLVVEDALATLEEFARENSIVIEGRVADGLTVLANFDALVQVLTNLLDNAIKHTEPGGQVDVEAGVVGGRIVLKVSDSGCGIPDEDCERVFERFFRVDKGRSRDSGGSGLGLAIVKHIVLSHGGQVSVRSEEGNGSTFRVELPRGNLGRR